MRVFAIGIEHPLHVPVQCPHDTDACKHGRPVVTDDQEQSFDRGLPLVELLIGLRKLRDVSAGFLAAVRSRRALVSVRLHQR